MVFFIQIWVIDRFEEMSLASTSCKEGEKCIGGYARAVTVIKQLKEENAKNGLNPIYLNAGDNFQGTLWYSFGRWNVTTQFLNMLDADAIVSVRYDSKSTMAFLFVKYYNF